MALAQADRRNLKAILSKAALLHGHVLVQAPLTCNLDSARGMDYPVKSACAYRLDS
jgi:hypothetical protein